MNLISKKDLLAITGISYGQLYRWKRERLIPEEWFIKQSAYTGQETFFPREQILSRIRSILDLKDQYSLEELAKILSPETSAVKIIKDHLKEIDELHVDILEFLPKVYPKEHYEFIEVAFMIILSNLVRKQTLSLTTCRDLLERSISAASRQKSSNVLCTIFHTDKEYHALFTPSVSFMEFDETIQRIDQQALSDIADKIKVKYKNHFI